MNLTQTNARSAHSVALERRVPVLGPVGIRVSWLALGVAVAMSFMSRLPLESSLPAAHPKMTPPAHAKVASPAVPRLIPQPAIPGSMSFDGEVAAR